MTLKDLIMKRPTLVWLLPFALGLSAPAFAASVLGCQIEPEHVADVGSPVIGVIERVEVDRGDRVRKGQVLAVLRADVERAALSVARSRADSDADVQASSASAIFSRERLQRAEGLFRQQFISQQALDQIRTEANMAEQKLAQARNQYEVSLREREVAAAQVSQRVIRSPMDGVVSERYLSAGERIDEKPLLRIAVINPLRVQLVVPTSMYGQVQAGQGVSVVPELPGAVPVTAHVRRIDKVIDPASNTFRVQLVLPNAELALPAGLRCKADFQPVAAAGSAR